MNSAEIVNGWRYSMGGGRAGYDLALRAAFATHLLGANVPEQLFYPNVLVDAENRPSDRRRTSTCCVSGKIILPPVSVFWNTCTDDDKEFFIENDFKRYSIGSTTDGLKTDADGWMTINIEHENPGADKQSNWLPAPSGGVQPDDAALWRGESDSWRVVSTAGREAHPARLVFDSSRLKQTREAHSSEGDRIRQV